MITISTANDSTNDIYINASGDIAMSEDILALANVSKNRVLTTKGESEFNQLEGIPYFETIFTDRPKIDLFQAAVVQSLEAQEEVQRVSNFEYTQQNGVFSYSLTEKTTYGDITVNG